MNTTEILLIHSRLRNAISNYRTQFRKPKNSRNKRALMKAKNSVRTLNEWLCSEPNANKVIRSNIAHDATSEKYYANNLADL